MTHRISLASLLALFVLFGVGCQVNREVVAVSLTGEIDQSTRSAATVLLSKLSEDQKKLAVHDIKAPLKNDWHFVPRQRAGLMLGDMTAQQKTLVHNLMQTALSDSGYLKATDIIWLETVLYEMSNENPMRDPGKYALQIFGDPTDVKAAWGWRLEGHHLSLNLTYAPTDVSHRPLKIAVTPLFFGANPAVVQQGPLAGKRVLSDVHSMAVELATSMNDEQREKMMLDHRPRDVITGPGREKALGEIVGLNDAEMTPKQRVLLFKLLHTLCGNFDTQHRGVLWGAAVSRRKQVSDGTLDLSIAWAGPIDADKPFYFRIHGPAFVAEYSCQGRNHVHFVIHDLTDPLQEDLLKKHFEQHEH